MRTQTFTATFLENRDASVKIEHNGITAFIPRSQIEYLKVEGERATLTISHWCYRKKFEKVDA